MLAKMCLAQRYSKILITSKKTKQIFVCITRIIQQIIVHLSPGMKEKQKKAIIMGATSGIGLEMVKVLTAQGWQVGIAGRRQERLQQIQSKNLDVVATECIDITKEDAPRRLLTLIGKTGGMDLYFHSAGVGYQNPSLNIEKEMATVATNVTGFTQMVDTAFHYFMEHSDREAHLAVISSIDRKSVV